MSKQIEAIYENGVLRPLEPLSLDEHQRVTITITEESGEEEDLLIRPSRTGGAEQSRDAPSLEKVRQALSKIQGSMAAVVIAERDER